MRLLLILLLFNDSQVDQRLARIVDKDQFTNVRSGQGLSFEVVDTVRAHEFFYCEPTQASDWYKVTLLKWYRHSGEQITGYIHKSRVQIIEDLKISDQSVIILSVLKKEKQLADRFLETNKKYNRVLDKWDDKNDSVAYKKAVGELEPYSETTYSAILQILPKVFCNTKDMTIIENFISTMWSDKGSASEEPSFSIGKCFACDPKLLSARVRQIKNKEEKELIVNHIEWGLLNIFSVDEKESTDTKYLGLKNQLEKVRN